MYSLVFRHTAAERLYILQGVRRRRDITSSAILFVYLQTWQALFVVLITIGSVSFFTYVGSSGSSASLNWTLVSFVVILPNVLLLYLVRVALPLCLKPRSTKSCKTLSRRSAISARESSQIAVNDAAAAISPPIPRRPSKSGKRRITILPQVARTILSNLYSFSKACSNTRKPASELLHKQFYLLLEVQAK